MQTQTFNRKPFDPVEAIRVTDANMSDVTNWCGGMVHRDPRGTYIDVPVSNPRNERQTKAYVGDWVLASKTGFKSYNDKAFHLHFDATSASNVTVHVTQNFPQAAAPVPASADTDALQDGPDVEVAPTTVNVFDPTPESDASHGYSDTVNDRLHAVSEADAIAGKRR